MHSGEEWFTFSWQDYAVFALVVAVYLILVFRNKLPGMATFKDFTDTINTAGGHLIILTLFSLYFFRTAMRFFLHVLGLPDEVVTKNNAIIMTGIAFLTGTAFGGAWAALIKTMTGGKAVGDVGNGSSPPIAAIPPAPGAPSIPAPSAPPAPAVASAPGAVPDLSGKPVGFVANRAVTP